jgi:hypothetical protein
MPLWHKLFLTIFPKASSQNNFKEISNSSTPIPVASRR